MTKDKTKLSLTTEGTTITVEFDNIDVDLDQYFQAFKTLLIGATFNERDFEQWVINEAEVVGEFLERQKGGARDD